MLEIFFYWVKGMCDWCYFGIKGKLLKLSVCRNCFDGNKKCSTKLILEVFHLTWIHFSFFPPSSINTWKINIKKTLPFFYEIMISSSYQTLNQEATFKEWKTITSWKLKKNAFPIHVNLWTTSSSLFAFLHTLTHIQWRWYKI